MKTKTVLLTIFALLLMMAGSGCKEDKELIVQKDEAIIHYSNPATDGCGWLISINEKEYHPVNLNESFKINGQKVNLSYKVLQSNWKCEQWNVRFYQELEIITITKF